MGQPRHMAWASWWRRWATAGGTGARHSTERHGSHNNKRCRRARRNPAEEAATPRSVWARHGPASLGTRYGRRWRQRSKVSFSGRHVRATWHGGTGADCGATWADVVCVRFEVSAPPAAPAASLRGRAHLALGRNRRGARIMARMVCPLRAGLPRRSAPVYVVPRKPTRVGCE